MRLIIYIVVAYIIYVIAKKFLSSQQAGTRRGGRVPGGAKTKAGPGAGEPEAAETVLDPVCGSYLAKDLAITVNKDGKTVYFCGEECRDKFTSEGGG